MVLLMLMMMMMMMMLMDKTLMTLGEFQHFPGPQLPGEM